MSRILIAAMLLTVVAAPAFACDYNVNAATDDQSKTLAQQPTNDQTTPPATTTDNHTSS